jgi:hypothetical protein
MSAMSCLGHAAGVDKPEMHNHAYSAVENWGLIYLSKIGQVDHIPESTKPQTQKNRPSKPVFLSPVKKQRETEV